MRVKTVRGFCEESRKLCLNQRELEALQRAMQIVEQMRDYVEHESDIDYTLAEAEHGLRAVIAAQPLVLEWRIVMPRRR